MSEQITLTADAGRALQEAENCCWRTNVGILAPEHLLAGCLKVLGMVGLPGVPGEAAIEAAVLASQGSGEERLTQDVIFGSAARDALSYTARLVAQAGGGEIDTLTLAYGVAHSGELGPMFFTALGMSKAELVAVLCGGA